jgi:predicted kinase
MTETRDEPLPVLIITRGLPASGKSTWARQWVGEDPKRRAEVNRDMLRLMMHGGFADAEPQVTAAEHAAIEALLRKGISVTCSDTNLPQRTARLLAKIARRAHADLEVRDLTDVPLDTCLARNAARTDKEPVPEDRIRAMHARYVAGRKHPLPWPDEPEANAGGLVPYVPKPGTPQAVLCDIDGTLAIHQGRSPYDYTRVSEDAVNPSVAEFLHLAAWRVDGHRGVILMSGRPETARADTEEWLARYQVPFDELHMRAAGDMRNDVIVKSELFDAHVRDRFSVIVALDDRNRVVQLWRALGLSCWQVNDGDF